MTGGLEQVGSLTPKQLALLELRLRRARPEPARSAIPRRAAGTDPLPLSFAQQRLWFLHQLDPHRSDYHIHGALRLAGRLDGPTLERSLREIVRRHEALRTLFRTVADQPVQRVQPPPGFVLPTVDLTGLEADRRDAAARDLLAEEGCRPFDLAAGPVYRFLLLREAAASHLLALTFHHIVADGWSMQIFLDEMADLYRAFAAGRPSPLPELPVQYPDFALWQRDILRGPALEKELDYWRHRLAGPLPVLRLAEPGRPRPAERSRPGVARRRLSRDVADRLRELSHRQGATLFMTLLALYKGLLFHLTRQDDLLVGTTVAERNRPETERLIGFLVNVLVLRTDLGGNPGFAGLLGRVRETVLGALAHQELPFDKLVEELQPDRDASRFPLVQAGFELAHDLRGSLSLPGLEMSAVEVEDRTVRGDLLLLAEDLSHDGLLCTLEYDGGLFEPDEAERLLGHLAQLADLVLEDPERPVKLLPLLRAEMAAALGLEAGRMERIAPLNPTQRDIYLGHVRSPRSTVYVIGLSLPLPASLDPDRWRRAVELVVAREEAMRTRLFTFRGEVLQFADHDAGVSFEVMEADLDQDSPALVLFVDRTVRQPFEEIHGADLFRHGLIRTRDGGWIAVLRVHHILFDGFSANAFFERATAVYEELAGGREPRLPDSGSFYDAVGESLERMDTAAAEAYWTARLAGVVPLQALAPAQPAPGLEQRRLAGPVLEAIRGFCARHGCRVPSFLLAAYGALLGRLFQPDGDFVVHNLVSARRKGPFLRTLGCFFQVFPVVFRRDLLAAGGIPTLLQEVDGYRRTLGPMENVSVYLQKRILRDSGLGFYFNYYRYGRIEGFGGELRIQDHVSNPSDEVHLVVRDSGDELLLNLFSDPYQLRDRVFLDRLVSVMTQMAAGAAVWGRLELLSGAERQQLLVEWNDTAAAFPPAASLTELFEVQVARTPGAVAVDDGTERLSYRGLSERSRRLAAGLAAAGAGPETVVGLLGPRNNAFLAAILAVFQAGAAYLPLDPRHPPARWAQVLARAGCPLVLVSREHQEGLAAALAAHSAIPRLLPLEPALAEPAPAPVPEPPRDPRHLAYVIFTSGSTGVPKGAMLEQRGMLNHLWAKVSGLGLGPGDAVAQTASQSFDISVWQFLAALLVGGRVEVFDDESAFDGNRLLPEVARRGVTVLETVPSLLRAVLEAGVPPPLPPLRHLRWLVPTGEALTPDLCRAWLAVYPDVPLVNAYGPTECSDDVTHFPVRETPGEKEALVPIGRSLANLRLAVLDRGLHLLPAALAGELYVGGVGVGRGYLGDPAATARAFVPDPFAAAPGERLYRTGDLARRRPGGELEFLGRLDHQVKIRGYRIELGEIESALRRQPKVAQCAVVARESPAGGRLVAYVVGEGGSTPDTATLSATLREELPDAMVPSAFVILEALPLTPNGKLDRAALPEPESARPADEREYVAPRDELERELAGLWEDLLGVRPVGVTDSFFDLGGQSLLAVRLMAHVKSRFGRDLPLAALFSGRTVEALADLLRRDASVLVRSPLIAMQPQGGGVPLFCIHPGSGDILCYFDLVGRLGRGRPVYGLQDPALYGAWPAGFPFVERASRYIDEIRRVWPAGPYLLLGWSFGGQVAFEMAQQLRRAGAEVPFVGILDTLAPVGVAAFADSVDDTYYLAVIAAESRAPLTEEELRALPAEARAQRVAEAIRAAGAAFPGLDAGWVRDRLALFKSRFDVLRDYRPEIYPGRLTLFLAAEDNTDELAGRADSTLGWGAWAAGGVDVQFVPGTHATMGAEPHAAVLAERLAACLESLDLPKTATP